MRNTNELPLGKKALRLILAPEGRNIVGPNIRTKIPQQSWQAPPRRKPCGDRRQTEGERRFVRRRSAPYGVTSGRSPLLPTAPARRTFSARRARRRYESRPSRVRR
jgi:hypothetical protein